MTTRKITFKVKYKKGVTYNPIGVANIRKWILKRGIDVHVLEAGKMSDDSEFVTIRIEGIKHDTKRSTGTNERGY